MEAVVIFSALFLGTVAGTVCMVSRELLTTRTDFEEKLTCHRVINIGRPFCVNLSRISSRCVVLLFYVLLFLSSLRGVMIT